MNVKTALIVLSLVSFSISYCDAEERAATVQLRAVPIKVVSIDDEFWSPKRKTWHKVTILDCFEKFENEGALSNFDTVASGTGGAHHGQPWYDGLIYEMITGSADFLISEPDAELESRIDGYVKRITLAAAKDPHGYINTYTQLLRPNHHWGLHGGDDNWQHDIYNAGALIEAGVHYYRATSKIDLLKTAIRLANHLDDVIGPDPKTNQVPGHSLIEQSLVELYSLFHEQPDLKTRVGVQVNEQRYLKLAEFFIENRGVTEGRRAFGAYGQDHLPVLRQPTIEGHAVRATLLCAGLVAAANENGRSDYLVAAQRLWNNMVHRRMYVNGGLGSVAGHEGFGPDYSLPNNGYLETCAAVGAGFFHHNMNLAYGDARYVDELERVLYNSVLSGVSIDGRRYFYENPLEGSKQRTRWSWHACPCCPPMFLKIMGALPSYIYAQGDDGVYVNLFVGSTAKLTIKDTPVELRQSTRYPWDGAVSITLTPTKPVTTTVRLRIPAWCTEPQLRVNGDQVGKLFIDRGYVAVERLWRSGDVIDLTLPMPITAFRANPKLTANAGRSALQRGPIVYCLEGCDNKLPLNSIVVPASSKMTSEFRPHFLGGVTVIKGEAIDTWSEDWPDTLYLPESRMPHNEPKQFLAIPYFANANREPTEMTVWVDNTELRERLLRRPTIASRSKPTASHCNSFDTVNAMNDLLDVRASDDQSIPRFTWWDHRGTQEWVQYDFQGPQQISSVDVYWWDERRINAHCRVPQSWRVLYKVGDDWKPIPDQSKCETEIDQFNRVTFQQVETSAIRLEVQLQPEWSAGILEWRVE